MKKIWWVFVPFIGIFIGIGLFFTNKVMYIKKKEDDFLEEREEGTTFYSREDFQNMDKEKLMILSPFGYKLHGWYLPKEGSQRFIILCHGVTVNHINSVKYANLFLSLGFHVILYDHRRHGQSGGKTTSYGYYEKYDLGAVINWVKQRFGEDVTIGLHGESMGAATILQYGGTVADTVDFYIADCSFATFAGQLTYRLKEEFRLPKWPFLSIANLFIKFREGYSFHDISPIEAVKKIKKPILFVHSKGDMYIPMTMTEELYKAKIGDKQLYLAELGDHGQSYIKNPEVYKEVVREFLTNYILSKRQ